MTISQNPYPESPPPPERIALLGFSGSGKSTVGQILAAQLQWPHVDLDQEIVQQSGRSITDWFAHTSEDEFRRYEYVCLQHILKTYPHLVLSCGGGTFTFPPSRFFLLQMAWCIALDVSLDTVMQRLSPVQRAARPLLQKYELNAFFADRQNILKLCPHHCSTEQKTPTDVAADILHKMQIRYTPAADVLAPPPLWSKGIHIEHFSETTLSQTIARCLPPTMQQSVMIADANAAQYWRKHLTAAYKKARPHHPLLWINVLSDKNHPERYKNLSTVTQIYRVLWKYKCQRQTTLLMALGGGVLLDMVGFVAATYQRGLPLWMFPSTTMAAVDASIGGKNGINWRKRKNQIGTIRPPEHIFVVLDYLRTQTKRHKHAGLAEVVKIAALADAHFFRRMQTHTALILAEDPTVWKHVILKAAQLKYAFVEQDLLDRGARQALNWGHTLGHAFEILSEGKLYHGEAVSLGLLAEYAFACRQQQGSPVLYAQLEQLLESLSLPTNWQSYIQHYNLSALSYALEGDKKRQGENVLLTTVAPLGVWSFYKASVKSLLEFLKEYTD